MEKLRFSLITIFSGMCFLGALIVGTPLLIENIFWSTDNSIFVTKYILLSYLAFFLILLGIIVPIFRIIFKYLKITKINPFDGLATILLLLFSGIPLIILSFITIIVFKKSKNPPYKYFNFAISATLFLMGVIIRYHGKKEKKINITIVNHTSPIDYFIWPQVMGTDPWNVVAGINLSKNKKTLGDKFLVWLVGSLIEEYTITVDRASNISKGKMLLKMKNEINKGKSIILSPEGGRIPKIKIIKDKIILQEFLDGAFSVAWEKNIPIQPIVLDWPVIWRGKGEDWWGVHPCIVDIYYLSPVWPINYLKIEDFKQECWSRMEKQLRSSKKVQRFLKD